MDALGATLCGALLMAGGCQQSPCTAKKPEVHAWNSRMSEVYVALGHTKIKGEDQIPFLKISAAGCRNE